MEENRNLGRDKLDFGNGKIGKLFRALFFPTLVAMIFTSALTVIDGIFVGHGVADIYGEYRHRTYVRHRGFGDCRYQNVGE